MSTQRAYDDDDDATFERNARNAKVPKINSGKAKRTKNAAMYGLKRHARKRPR